MDLNEFFYGIRDFFSDTTKKIIFICALLVFMVICALLVFVAGGKHKEAKRMPSEQRKINADSPLLVPSGPEVPDEYITSRITEKNWSESEVNEWFSVPDGEKLEKLGESNDRMIDEIIGAAP